MWSKRFWSIRYWTGRFWPPSGVGVAPPEEPVIAESAALDWTLPPRRLHCELARTRIEATMPYGRLAFETPGEQVSYTLPQRRLDYSLEVTA